MKYLWEDTDMRGGRISKSGGERWMIGYTGGNGSIKSGTFALISLSDGMVCMSLMASELAERMTHDEHVPVGWAQDMLTKALDK
jgi:hypothetical protein